MSEQNLITTHEAAKLAGVGARRITVLAAAGRLDGKKVSGQWRIDPESVQAYLDSQAPPAILDQPEKLEAVYREAGSYIAAAEVIGCDKKTVAKAIHRHGIKPNPAYWSRPKSGSGTRVKRKTTAAERKRLRWMDMAIIFLQHGLTPVPLAEMCPIDCPGRDSCMDGGPCVMGGNGNGGRTA